MRVDGLLSGIKRAVVFFFLVCGVALASPPSCPAYPYHDFTWASAYSYPPKPPDTLLDNCEALGLNNPQLCSSVNDSRLTIEQKKQLILDDFVRNNGYPPFSEADSWNGRIAFTKHAPDGVATHSSTYLKDAWVKIIAINPAVIDSSDNRTYINDTGMLRLAKGFSFVVPAETFSGDCRTDYAICGYDYSLTAYDNGASLGNHNLPIANFTVGNRTNGAPNNFSAVLTVNSEYMIHHYRLVTHCIGRYCYTTCDYSGTDDRHDSIAVSDSQAAYYYGFVAFQNAFVDSFQNNLTDAWLFVVSNEDFNNIRFSIGDSFLKLQSRQYQLGYSLPPYNALTPAFKHNPNRLQTRGISILSRETRTLSGPEFDSFLRVTEPALYYLLTEWLGIDPASLPITFHGDKIHFLAPAQSLNCTVEINSHFGRQVFEDACNYNETQKPIINLTISNATNASFIARAHFYENSTGQPLIGKNISFSYGSYDASAVTDEDGLAEINFPRLQGNSLVSAVFLTDFETKSAKAYAVVPSEAPNFLSQLGIIALFAFALWLGYKLLKKWFP